MVYTLTTLVINAYEYQIAMLAMHVLMQLESPRDSRERLGRAKPGRACPGGVRRSLPLPLLLPLPLPLLLSLPLPQPLPLL